MKISRRSPSLLVLAAGVTAWRLSRSTGIFRPDTLLSRRILLKLGGLGLTGLVTGAWRSRGLLPAAEAASYRGNAPAVRCILAPEQTEGPYYIAREKVRRNIAEHKPGTPLQLRLMVVDAATCAPIKGAAVDIWHCDGMGIYSGFQNASRGGAPGPGGGPTDTATFLRGIQFTNAQGLAEFDTIYPGWYRGRTVHIHVKVHLAGDTVGHVVHTGQLYFSDTLTARVYQAEPYRARAAQRDTFNDTDAIYRNGGPQSMLGMKPKGHSYIGSIVLGVRRS